MRGIAKFVGKEKMPKKVEIYDTTLRDGSQSERISFSVKDKVRIAERLDEIGVTYIEGGWPGSNPKDIRFFEKIKDLELENAKIVAFGSTRKGGVSPEKDLSMNALLEADTSMVCIFGKSWDLHVRDALNVPLEENLEMIKDSVSYLKSKGRKVIYDAEHFFDAYKANPDYALETLKRAENAGAECIVLCDTNGGCMPYEVEWIVDVVKERIKTPLGIHAHNDTDVAVANTLVAVRKGIVHVQGTINGYGERSGNANLCSVIPDLKLKLGIDCITDEQLKKLTEVSRFVSEIANLSHRNNLPYVGASAFAHKGGVHIDAVQKNPQTYEHIKPNLVGNTRRVLVSELSGRSSIISKSKEYGLDLEKDTKETKKIMDKVKALEDEGYQFEGAEASFELLVMKILQPYEDFFELEGYRTIVEKHKDGRMFAEATTRLKVGGEEKYTAAEGDGPVNALDMALREALEGFYPGLKDMHLTDYKVRVLDAKEGTAAKVRVLIESSDKHGTWRTVGVSENIIEASWEALRDSIEYKLLKNHRSNG
ncbi:MAG: citramalate synthase [Candidatus Hydrothermarchaeales archaeon]